MPKSMSARQTQSCVVPVESSAVRSPFSIVADRHKWMPGAREMAFAEYKASVLVRHVYHLMAAELKVPKVKA